MKHVHKVVIRTRKHLTLIYTEKPTELLSDGLQTDRLTGIGLDYIRVWILKLVSNLPTDLEISFSNYISHLELQNSIIYWESELRSDS